MLAYIKNILPRIQRYTNKLDNVENFVGRKWLLIDEASNGHSYEFLRDGRLVMSIVTKGTEQETKIGSWELLPSERLLVHRPEPLILEQAFLGDGLLIFKDSGTTKKPFSLYDPKVIIDGDVEAYLNKFLEVKEAAQISNTEETNDAGNKVYRNPDGSLYNGELIDKDDNKLTHIIEDGIEISRYYIKAYNTDKGAISIKISKGYFPRIPDIKDEVFLGDGSNAPDGIYKLQTNEYDLGYITVVNGKVDKVDYINHNLTLFIIVVLAMILGSIIIRACINSYP